MICAPVFGLTMIICSSEERSSNRNNKHQERLAEIRQWSLNESRIQKMSDEELEGVAAATAREMAWRRETRLRTSLVDVDG